MCMFGRCIFCLYNTVDVGLGFGPQPRGEQPGSPLHWLFEEL